MPNRYAVATGNWSNVATWDGGTTLPQPADSVCANGYTVTIDQDVTVVLITTAALGSGAAGGGFAISTARTINANITAGSTTCLTASHTSGNTVTVNGAITGGSSSNAYGFSNNSTGAVVIAGNVTGGTGSGATGAYNSSTGTVAITGNVSSGSGGSFAASGVANISSGTVQVTGNVTSTLYGHAITNTTGTVTITGNVTGGSIGSASGVYNSSNGTITITGNVTGGSGSTCYGVSNVSTGTVSITGSVIGGNGTNAYGVNNASTGTITINGNLTAGSGTGAIGLYNNSTGTVTVIGDITASSNNVGFWSETYGGHLRLDGSIYAHASGWCGVSAPRIGYVTATDEITQYPEAGAVAPNFSGSLVTHYGASQGVFGQAGIADVRNGTVYGPSSELTGTCHVPAAASVLYGVPVDATTGTAAVNAAAIAAIVAEITGNGPYAVTITVTDDNSDPVQGAVVRLSKTGEAYTATTNASGVVTYSLDAATWTVAITAGGSYAFTPTSLVVSANTSQSYQLTDNAPAAPASPLLSTGYVDCYGLDGAAEAGVDVEIELTSGPGTVGYALDKGTYTATSAINGRVTHSGFIRGATYRARRGEFGKWVSFTVANASTFQMPEILGQP